MGGVGHSKGGGKDESKVGGIGTDGRIGRRYGTVCLCSVPNRGEPTKENTDESGKKKRERERNREREGGRKKKREENPPKGSRGRQAAERAPAAPHGEQGRSIHVSRSLF